MKFSHIAIGARFRYQGKVYSKCSPLAASESGGRQRMVPRSAIVDPLENSGEQAKQTPPLSQALSDYHAQCHALLRAATSASPNDAAALALQLDQAFTALTAKIDALGG